MPYIPRARYIELLAAEEKLASLENRALPEPRSKHVAHTAREKIGGQHTGWWRSIEGPSTYDLPDKSPTPFDILSEELKMKIFEPFFAKTTVICSKRKKADEDMRLAPWLSGARTQPGINMQLFLVCRSWYKMACRALRVTTFCAMPSGRTVPVVDLPQIGKNIRRLSISFDVRGVELDDCAKLWTQTEALNAERYGHSSAKRREDWQSFINDRARNGRWDELIGVVHKLELSWLQISVENCWNFDWERLTEDVFGDLLKKPAKLPKSVVVIGTIHQKERDMITRLVQEVPVQYRPALAFQGNLIRAAHDTHVFSEWSPFEM